MMPTDKMVHPPKSKDAADEDGPIGRASLPGPSQVHRNEPMMDDFIGATGNDGAAKVEVVANADEEERNNFVVGFFSDFFASYKHIQNHKAKFILFLTLSISHSICFFS